VQFFLFTSIGLADSGLRARVGLYVYAYVHEYIYIYVYVYANIFSRSFFQGFVYVCRVLSGFLFSSTVLCHSSF